MRLCEACQREFHMLGRSPTCPYCGFNTDPRGQMPRSKASLALLEQRRRREEEEEQELREYFDLDTD